MHLCFQERCLFPRFGFPPALPNHFSDLRQLRVRGISIKLQKEKSKPEVIKLDLETKEIMKHLDSNNNDILALIPSDLSLRYRRCNEDCQLVIDRGCPSG